MQRTKWGNVSYSQDELNKYGGFTPTEVSKIVNLCLLGRPNRSIVFSNFVSNIVNQFDFISFTIDNAKSLDIDSLKGINVLCDKKIEGLKLYEITMLEKDINEKQKKLSELKGK